MYLIFMDAWTGEILLSKRSNQDPVSRIHAATRVLLEKKYPGSLVLSPSERVPSKAAAAAGTVVVLVTVYKSTDRDGCVGRAGRSRRGLQSRQEKGPAKAPACPAIAAWKAVRTWIG